MPISMNCPSCGKNLSAPDTAAGKKAKCPACGQIMVVPEVVHDAEEFGSPPPQPSTPYSPQPPAGSTENWLNDVQGAAAPTAPGPGGEARRPCPECGEMIMVGAAKCRFCNAIFDPNLKRLAAKKTYGPGDENLTTGDSDLLHSLCRYRLHRRNRLRDSRQAERDEDGRNLDRRGSGVEHSERNCPIRLAARS